MESGREMLPSVELPDEVKQRYAKLFDALKRQLKEQTEIHISFSPRIGRSEALNHLYLDDAEKEKIIKGTSRLGTLTILDEYSVAWPGYWKREFQSVCESGLSYLRSGQPIPDDLRERGQTAAMYIRMSEDARKGRL